MTRMTDDRLEDVYYDASWSDETVSLKGLRAVSDAAERQVLDELRKKYRGVLGDIGWAIGHEIRMREELDRGDG